jgi:hypothetical protein
MELMTVRITWHHHEIQLARFNREATSRKTGSGLLKASFSSSSLPIEESRRVDLDKRDFLNLCWKDAVVIVEDLIFVEASCAKPAIPRKAANDDDDRFCRLEMCNNDEDWANDLHREAC